MRLPLIEGQTNMINDNYTDIFMCAKPTPQMRNSAVSPMSKMSPS